MKKYGAQFNPMNIEKSIFIDNGYRTPIHPQIFKNNLERHCFSDASKPKALPVCGIITLGYTNHFYDRIFLLAAKSTCLRKFYKWIVVAFKQIVLN